MWNAFLCLVCEHKFNFDFDGFWIEELGRRRVDDHVCFIVRRHVRRDDMLKDSLLVGIECASRTRGGQVGMVGMLFRLQLVGVGVQRRVYARTNAPLLPLVVIGKGVTHAAMAAVSISNQTCLLYWNVS